jgi:hypothetical protein
MARIRTLLAATVLAAGTVLGAASVASADFDTDYHDPLTAEKPLHRPDTRSCSVEVMHEKAFANGFGNPPDTPFVGSLSVPSACAGPWSMVVLDLHGRVKGRQFDRLFNVFVGGVQIMMSSTPEPSADGIEWTVEHDVSRYAPVFTGTQPFVFDLANVTDSTFTGVYFMSATFTFYTTSQRFPAAATADQVLTVSNGRTDAAPGFFLEKQTLSAGRDLVFPRNLTRLSAEVYTKNSGPCEEFDYASVPDAFKNAHPDAGFCGKGPFRELRLSIDGRLAGVVWPYPVIYTGGWDPLLWRPIPAIFAFDLPAYQLDLSPYVGLLVDGRPHRIDIGINTFETQPNDGWLVQANLFATVDRHLSQTRGGLLVDHVAPDATVTSQVADTGGGNGHFHVTAARHDLAVGWVQTSRGPVLSEVRADLSFDSAQDYLNGFNDDNLVNTTDLRRTSTTAGGGLPTVHSVHEVEPLSAHLIFTDLGGGSTDQTVTMNLAYHKEDVTVAGARVDRLRIDHTITPRSHRHDGDSTVRAGSSTEDFRSVGPDCYHRNIQTVDGQITSDTTGC